MAKLSRRQLIIGGAAATTVVGCGGAISTMRIPAGGPSYTLTPQYSTNVYGGKTLHTRTYGSIPGPTLMVSPGQTLTVTLNNQLPPDPAATVPTKVVVHPGAMADMMTVREQAALPAATSTSIDPMNNPHLFNTTNLHVHGLQVVPHIFDPVGTSDPNAMQIAVAPGTSRTYTFDLPPDQPSGLFWYHPHHHGSSDVEVSGGMAGLIIVKGPIDQVPEIAAARDIPIAVQTIQVQQDATTPGLYTLEPKAYQTPANGGYTPRSPFIFVLVNGQLVNFLSGLVAEQPGPPISAPAPPPVTSMQPGEVVRLRILNGSNALLFPLRLPGFQVYLIANDGVNVLAPQLIDQTTGVVQISPGNRTELLVQAPSTPGTYTLSSLAVPDPGKPWPQFDFMQFVVSGTPVTMGIPATLPTPTRMYPPIADSEIVASRTITFSSVSSTASLTGTALTINGSVYNEMSVLAQLQTGTAQRWTLVNTMSEGHPYHIHTNSFEVHSVTGPTGTTTYNPPYIADTVWIPPNGTVIIQSRYKQWKGKDVFHCHKLTHEDQGMMANTMLT